MDELDVIINGIRHKPDEDVPDKVSFWYMRDNHTFDKLYGTTLDDVLQAADSIETESSGGMLCPVLLLSKEKEIRRVGPCVHSRGTKDLKEYWNLGIAKWRKAVEADADVMRLLPTNTDKRQRTDVNEKNPPNRLG